MKRDLGGFPIPDSAQPGTSQAPLKRQKMTLKEIQDARLRADYEYNVFMMAHETEREAYERDIDALESARLSEFEYQMAKKDLAFITHRRYCLGHAGEPGAFWYHLQMDKWREIEAAYGIDKWSQDEVLNEVEWWYKVMCEGSRNPAHHAHEPVKGQVFLPGGPVQKAKDYEKMVFHPSAPAPKKRSSTVGIKNNPLG